MVISFIILDAAALIEDVNNAIWTYALIGALVVCGLYFTFRSRGVQIRMFFEMFRLLGESGDKHDGKNHVSSFQAFAVSVATRVGTGNLAGVATAIALGGPGAVFWMWMIAIVGAATAFVESTLAQIFKQPSKDSFIGGPAYYILYGMKNRWLAVTFAVLITLTFGLSYNSVQANTLCGAMDKAFGLDPIYVGIAIVVLSLLIVFGGIKRISQVSSVIVPIMAIGYFILALVVVAMNYKHFPSVIKLIISDAFGFGQAAGGAIGMAILHGVRRGVFSNEAGEGSAPNAAATASTSHPVKQGLIQSLGVFTDTLLVCSCTAFIILISGIYGNTGYDGIKLTQAALSSQIGEWGVTFIAIAIFFFSFSSIIGNYYYGEANIRFLTEKRWVIEIFRILSGGVMVMFGAMASLKLVWSVGDIFMALLTACNLVAIITLSKYAFRALDDYRDQKRRGIKSPKFNPSLFPDQHLPGWTNK